MEDKGEQGKFFIHSGFTGNMFTWVFGNREIPYRSNEVNRLRSEYIFFVIWKNKAKRGFIKTEKRRRKMRIIILLIFCLLQYDCLSQLRKAFDTSLKMDYINEKKVHLFDRHYGLKYYLPYEVHVVLDSIVGSLLDNNSSYKKERYIVEYSTYGDTVALYGYKFRAISKKFAKSDRVSLVYRKSNRYLEITNVKMPLFFKSDQINTSLTFAFTHYFFYIKFVRNNNGTANILEFGQ
ncbi:hypothetical protein CJD36_017765 [Flavipsychrobacter stenotrophus]|uniref:Uncharacterized protein n=1 Tax=Flavipsychrobacter stenotrophus TaxID=2077091 RepID=A0A2S7ST51_9BACT|nr:hypothetical protein CJD36_017765 [Flavipsychrobacter stenotrophus]